jgi:diacylglycerol kinase (ATP)
MRAAAVFGLGTSPAELNPFRAGSTTEWIEGVPASSSDADAILIFGGDGTIHRHLPALVRLGLPVLVVPAGSGNDFARALKLRSSRDSLRAWRSFESGKSDAQAVDLGVIAAAGTPERPHYFCCVAGCGLDSIAARRANRMPRWLRGHGGYALALLPILFRPPAPRIRLTQFLGDTRQETDKPTLLVAFANTQFYGDGMCVAPRADFTDGKLDICRIGPMNSLKLLSMFPSVYSGRHLSMSEVEYTQAEQAFVETDTPLEIYADGEFVCETPVEIRVEPKAIRVITTPTQG